jgi:glycosyltransferase involved in cell wall biosynthesis
MSELRVGHIIEGLSPKAGGPSQVVLQMTQAQYKCGLAPTICCEDKPGEREDAERLISDTCKDHRPEVLWLPSGPTVGGRSLGLTARRHLRRTLQQFDVLHIHGMWSAIGWHAAQLAIKNDIPFVLRPAGMLEPWSLQHRGWKKRLMLNSVFGGMLRRTAAIHVTGEKEARGFEMLPYDRPVALLPNGVNVPPLDDDPRAILRHRWSHLADPRIALFIGRLHPVKGLDHLIPAWAEVQRQHPDWHLMLAGPDTDGYQAELEQKARALGVGETMTFIGGIWGQEKSQLTQAADLLVAPSLQENFGVSIAEGLAAQTPVITTDQTPWAVVRDHGCGWYIPVGDQPLATALAEAMASPCEQLCAMGQQGRQLVEGRYAWSTIAGQTRELYRWVASAGERPAFIHRR